VVDDHGRTVVSRVIAIGLDAVEGTLLDRLVREGRLPHLARLRARSATVALTSPVDFRAEAPWTEFVTGRRASTLRYWTTVAFLPESFDAHMRGAPDVEPFYAFGDEVTVVAFDVPKVVRSPRVRGVQILGWGAHSLQYPRGSMPDGELAAVHDRFGSHPGLPLEYAGGWNQPEYLARFARVQADAIRSRREILRWLAQRTPDWNLLLTLVGETHQLGHVTAHGFVGGRFADVSTAGIARRGIEGALAAIDDLVGDVVAWAPDDATVIVFSVHGIGEDDDGAAASVLPELLYRRATGAHRLPPSDLAAWRARGGGPIVPPRWQSPFAWTLDAFPDQSAPTRIESARAYAGHLLRRWAPAVLHARQRLRHSSAVPEPEPDVQLPLSDHSMDYWHPATFYRDAWPTLPAFVVPGYSDVHVRLSVAGRERAGVIDPDDYARACADVEDFLWKCRDGATGARAVREIHRVRADDPLAPDGPPSDLVVQLEGVDALEHPDVGAAGPMVAMRTAGHTTRGFAFVAGNGIAPGPRGTVEVCDVSATIAALLGARSPAPLDGTAFVGPGVHP
jgi:hypothetical protein